MWWIYIHKYIHIHVCATVCEGDRLYLGRSIAEKEWLIYALTYAYWLGKLQFSTFSL